jgi:hypothetical protein
MRFDCVVISFDRGAFRGAVYFYLTTARPKITAALAMMEKT